MPSPTSPAGSRLRACFAALLLLAGCHLGRPPVGPVEGGVELGTVRAAVAEPGLPDAVRSGLARGLVRLGVGGEGPRLEATVLEADVAVVGVTEGRRVHRARLAVSFSLLGPRPRQVVLRGERSYEASAADGLDASAGRAAAFEALAAELADDLAAWLALAPSAPDAR